jgi:hypothetical protein
MNKEEILKKILDERNKQASQPGSEYDANNAPNDWGSIISHYVNRECRRYNIIPERNDYEDSLIKAAAVLVAALEHLDVMKCKGNLK